MNIYTKLKRFLNLSFTTISLFGKSNIELKNRADLKELSKLLYDACVNHDLINIEKITIKILNFPKDDKLEEIFNTAVATSAWQNDLDAVKHFLNSNAHHHINVSPNSSLVEFSCDNDYVEIIDYLINHSNPKNKLDMHVNNDYLFIYVCQKNSLNIAEYLIFEQNIKKTENIKSYLTKWPNVQIEKMFEARDLNESLKQELIIEKGYKKRAKL
jgi:hypothetical protein